MARRMGADERWLAAARREVPESSDSGSGSEEGLEESWQLALRYAETVAHSGHSVTEEQYEQLCRHWQDVEIIEMTLVIGLFSYFNRVNDALRVEVTR